MSFHKPQSFYKVFVQPLRCFECILTMFLSFCIPELSHTFFCRRQAFRKHSDSMYIAKLVISMRLMRCAPNLHHNKVDSLHQTATVVDKEKKGNPSLFYVVMSPPEGLGDILFFPGRPSVRMSVCLSVCLSVTNRVRSVT